jgi:hypothetical protein
MSSRNNNNIPPKTKTKTKPNQTKPQQQQQQKQTKKNNLSSRRTWVAANHNNTSDCSITNKFLSSITTPETKENETCSGHERTNERARG